MSVLAFSSHRALAHATRRALPMVGTASHLLPAPTARANFSAAAETPAAGFKKPSIEDAQAMYREYHELPNDLVATLGIQGDLDAIRESLIRDIIKVDKCTYEEAEGTVEAIKQTNRGGKFIANLPYNVGVFTAYGAALVSIPFCFDLNTCLWFNKNFVTTDVPPTKDLETWLEVGSWSWAWMEPPLGQISFVLLCLQLSRAQMINVGIKPYTDRMRAYRAASLVRAYPRYNKNIVKQYSLLAQANGI